MIRWVNSARLDWVDSVQLGRVDSVLIRCLRVGLGQGQMDRADSISTGRSLIRLILGSRPRNSRHQRKPEQKPNLRDQPRQKIRNRSTRIVDPSSDREKNRDVLFGSNKSMPLKTIQWLQLMKTF